MKIMPVQINTNRYRSLLQNKFYSSVSHGFLNLVILNGDRPMDVQLVGALSRDISSVSTSKSLCSISVLDFAGLLTASE